MSDGRERSAGDRGEAVLAIFERGAELTRELLGENTRLRRELAALKTRQGQAAQSDVEWDKLREELVAKIDALECERDRMADQIRSIEDENRLFAERSLEVEEQNDNLASLYVASYQLHSTLDPGEVVKAILEIVINLIGAEVFAVYVCEDGSGEIGPVACEGEPLSAFPIVRAGEGLVGRSLETGNVELADPHPSSGPPSAGALPLVSIPLRVDDRPIGAIVIYELLQQKDGFSPLDHELFGLLAGHAATAIFASRLHAQSERKLNTIEGFIDLLTQ